MNKGSGRILNFGIAEIKAGGRDGRAARIWRARRRLVHPPATDNLSQNDTEG